jgi:ABC-type Fe3+-hydroxamate transport system substrate-binding protein
VALAPDVVVVNDEENRREDAEALTAAGVTVHVTHVASVADVDPMLRSLAGAVGADPPLTALPASAEQVQRSAFVPIWKRPWMTMNAHTYGSSVLERLGIANAFADAADRYPTVTLDDVAARAPDLVLLPTEPYPFAERHVAAMQEAVPGARVIVIDGQDLFWWGSRTPAALQRLATAVV